VLTWAARAGAARLAHARSAVDHWPSRPGGLRRPGPAGPDGPTYCMARLGRPRQASSPRAMRPSGTRPCARSLACSPTPRAQARQLVALFACTSRKHCIDQIGSSAASFSRDREARFSKRGLCVAAYKKVDHGSGSVTKKLFSAAAVLSLI
jgi:hypothetical protein